MGRFELNGRDSQPAALPASHEGFRRRDTSHLDAVRALAAFWVVSAHCMIWGGLFVLPIPDPKLAVDLFMVLSGFLMAYTLSRRAPGPQPSPGRLWLRFCIRRFFRIAPAYYVSLGLAVLLSGQFLGGYLHLREMSPEAWAHDTTYDPRLITYDLKNVLLHVTFLFGLSPRYSFSTLLPDWSLALEMQFYAVFPFIFLLARKHSPLLVCFVLIGASTVLAKAYGWGALHGYVEPFREASLLIFKLPIFLAGMLIFEAAASRRRWAMLALAGLVVASHARGYGLAVQLGFTGLVAVMAAPWLRPEITAFRWLTRSRIVGAMSDASYSVYLFHGLVLSLAGSRVEAAMLAAGHGKAAAVLATWGAVVALTYPVAILSHRFVERPGIRLGKWVAARVPQRYAAAPG